ncbi:MAG: hypothetical protein JWO98_5478, partial [Frankiales bacterium]|nr:hypothetical protein [Frankiales bacterium]
MRANANLFWILSGFFLLADIATAPGSSSHPATRSRTSF